MKTIIYHNPQWGKSRKSVEILKNKNINFTIIEYIKNPLKKDALKELLGLLDMEASDIVRTTEKDFVENNLSNIIGDEEKILEAIERHPRIMQRPIIICDRKAVIGRPPENINKII